MKLTIKDLRDAQDAVTYKKYSRTMSPFPNDATRLQMSLGAIFELLEVFAAVFVNKYGEIKSPNAVVRVFKWIRFGISAYRIIVTLIRDLKEKR